MDFSAWFEVYLGGSWYTFDARHNKPRIGRILMARGRDATDVAIATSFGPCTLAGHRPGGVEAARGSSRCSKRLRALFTDVEGDLRQSRKPENARRRGCDIDDPATHERTTIVDGHDHRAPIASVRHAHFGAERQRSMGGGQGFRVQLLTARSPASAINGVDRRDTGLILGRCGCKKERRKLRG
jgi:hypothetical protein